MTTTPNYCEGCEGSSGLLPITKMGYCVACATAACESANGEAVGLPTGYDLDSAIDALERHVAVCNVEKAACPVCAFGSSTCPECGDSIGHFRDADVWPHTVVGDFIVVCCEGYHPPVIRAIASRF